MAEKQKHKPQGGKSIGWVITMSMIVVGVIGWCMLATAYADYSEGSSMVAGGAARIRRTSGAGLLIGAIVKMAINGVVQIPSVFSVIKFAFQKRLGVVIGIVVVEVLLLVGGLWMKKVEKEMENEKRRY